MYVHAVIVTYADRFHLLKQVIEACFRESVDKVIVIDNNSDKNSKNLLREYNKDENRLRVVYLDKNTGSAGGYKRGLYEACQDSDCEFIWLLDDDNQPQKDSLDTLKFFWSSLVQGDKEVKVSLLSYREDRTVYKEAIMTNNPNLVIGKRNSFLGFHIVDLPKKIMKVFKRKFNIQTFKENKDLKSGLVTVAPYGGMYFHKNILNTIGYPNEDFFVYADDHDWSYRILKNGGSIYLVLDSLVDDIDTSWHIKSSSQIPFINYLFYGTDFRVYYAIRNRTYFEINSLVNNKLIYKINKFLFMNILILINFFSRKSKNRMKIIKSALLHDTHQKIC